ncbi:MAG: hypothetical protein CMN57_12545 [Gammaproteobacteria bacterium]|nr:hypothetical protein [Gammaproteobacteria bacterium]
MKHIIAAVLAGLLGMISTAGLAGDYEKQKVVYHINYDDPKLQTAAMRNIQNHINAVGAENLEVRVVMHGNGLSLLLTPEAGERLEKFRTGNADQKMAARIDGLRGQGVKFNVCNNTVRGRNVDIAADLHYVSEEDIVPSGVAEVSHLQQQGFTYIKP